LILQKMEPIGFPKRRCGITILLRCVRYQKSAGHMLIYWVGHSTTTEAGHFSYPCTVCMFAVQKCIYRKRWRV